MVVGAFLAKPCPCHNKAAKDDDDDDNEYQESIKPIIEKFYHVKYDFLDVKGNIIAKVLPAISSQNDLEERFFAFMKTVRKNKCTRLDTTDQTCIHQDVVQLLAFPNFTRQGEYEWE